MSPMVPGGSRIVDTRKHQPGYSHDTLDTRSPTPRYRRVQPFLMSSVGQHGSIEAVWTKTKRSRSRNSTPTSPPPSGLDVEAIRPEPTRCLRDVLRRRYR